jgi:co-chaperonin GroES (HSP10)
MKPLYAYVALEKVKSESGLALPDDMQNTGKVVAIGTGRLTDFGVEKLKVGIGDIVAYKGETYEVNDLIIVHEDNILAIL